MRDLIIWLSGFSLGFAVCGFIANHLNKMVDSANARKGTK